VLGSSIPGTISSEEQRRLHSRSSRKAGDRPVTLQCPTKHCPQPWEQSVGGVSERAGARAGGSHIPSRMSIPRARGGERHPGLPDGGALRGVPSERRPRSVRILVVGIPQGIVRAGDSGCPEVAEKGNVVSLRQQSVRHGAPQQRLRRRHVLRSVLRPVHVDPHYTPRRKSGGGATVRHHGWANPRKREEPTLGSGRTDVVRLAARHRSQQWERRGA
jgi:hypothetical protein